LPAYVEGRIVYGPGHSGNPESARLTLAIAVNDIIRATTRVWEEQGELRFLCRLPPESFVAGDNAIRVYGIVPDEADGVAWLTNFSGN
jgi:Ni,Fe-hydrogenase III large subunit